VRGRSRRKRIRSASSGWIFSSLIFPNSSVYIKYKGLRLLFIKKKEIEDPQIRIDQSLVLILVPTASVPVSSSRLCNMCWFRLHLSRPQGNEPKRGRPENYSSWVDRYVRTTTTTTTTGESEAATATTIPQIHQLSRSRFFLVHCNRDIHS
jgi:hypothetical protein